MLDHVTELTIADGVSFPTGGRGASGDKRVWPLNCVYKMRALEKCAREWQLARQM